MRSKGGGKDAATLIHDKGFLVVLAAVACYVFLRLLLLARLATFSFQYYDTIGCPHHHFPLFLLYIS